MFTKLRANFLTGTFIVIPLVFTFWILYFLIDKLNFLLLDPIAYLLDKWVPAQSVEIFTKIAIFFLLLAFLTLVGFATRIILLRNIFGFGEKILYRLPMVSNIYKAVKDISVPFLVQKNTIFKSVVLVEYPRKGIYQIGFVTSETKGEIKEKIKGLFLNVFIPTTPNPTSGVLIFVPKEDAILLDMPIAEAMKTIVSGGAVIPKIYNGQSENRCSASEKEGLKRD